MLYMTEKTFQDPKHIHAVVEFPEYEVLREIAANGGYGMSISKVLRRIVLASPEFQEARRRMLSAPNQEGDDV